ncbi:hypothetical protein Poli38472_003047 [Pythium oligandrum]|uniref:Dynein light intermediate chain n=1 Tax=Pythium oligandrum TaxID=41045 RepID=A0A8K1FEY7_PYTOL|nr:hypothetical protein Poli38472_003047 [Pythium oligandrum]|eukprot:TMW57122.1 hypothetical protein Poli38472_003047 [Pythium oligandrum]
MASAGGGAFRGQDVVMGDASTGNLWQQLLRDSSVRTRLPVVNLLVVGDHESGKSVLLSRLDERAAKDVDAADDAQPTSASTSALLSYRTMHVLDTKAKESGSADAVDDVVAHINTWVLNELPLAELLPIALKPHVLPQTIVAVVLDLSRPWTIKNALEQWTSTLEGQLLSQINLLPPEQRSQLYNNLKQYILEYEDPSVDHSVPGSIELSSKKEFLEDGALAKNLGVPLVIIVAKSDLRPDNSVKMDYIEYVLRQFAIKHGAAIFYTSAKDGTNIDSLRQYLVHRAFPTQFKFDRAPQLVDRNSVLIPAGYDSFTLVDQSLLGSQPKWPMDKPFDKIVPVPPEEQEDFGPSGSPGAMSETKLDPHERWLEKLEKAAGAGLEELQKQSVEASKKAEAAAAARRAAAERRKREEKDVSSTHLANFFNNLLSRPEKSKSGRSLDLKKKEKNDQSVKSLAEQELQNLSKRPPATSNGSS